VLSDEDLAAVVGIGHVRAHRDRGLSPDRPCLRGSAQNPDVFFQAREAINPFYAAVPRIVQATMDRLATRTGRRYRLVDYQGHPEADRVVVLMGRGPAPRRRPSRRSMPSGAGRAGDGAAVPAVPFEGWPPPCPRPCGGSRCWTGPRSRARPASRCTRTS
jgi:hypothetical protein